jgi:hypothetical protein
MNTKLHALQVEIKTIESLMDSLDSQMRRLAMEEVKNLRFEIETLNRNALLKAAKTQVVMEESISYV